jgi:hypothetical protein
LLAASRSSEDDEGGGTLPAPHFCGVLAAEEFFGYFFAPNLGAADLTNDSE